MFDAIYDPMALEDVAPEIELLGNILWYRRHLVSETLVDVANETSMLFN